MKERKVIRITDIVRKENSMVDDKLKKVLPTLHGSVGERFEEQAHVNEVNRASVDYTEQVESMRAILEESTKGEPVSEDLGISCNADLCYAHTGCKYYNPNKRSNVNHCIGGLPLQFIKMKKEEPVSKVWHDKSETPNGDDSIIIAFDNGSTVEPSFKDFKSYSEWKLIKESYRVKQWAYVNDVLNLINVEEPVSEDLKQEYEKYITNHKGEWIREDYEAFARHFANWSVQQMMKDAVESEVEITSKGILLTNLKIEDFDYADKARVIIIKED